MRVLYISHLNVAYGAGAGLFQLAVALKHQGDIPLVVVPEQGELSNALKRERVDSVEMECPWWVVESSASLRVKQWKLRRIIRSSLRLVHLIRRFKPDLVHTNSSVVPSGALAAYFASVPHIWHIREHVEEDFQLRFLFGRSVSHALMTNTSSALIAISKSVASAYKNDRKNERLYVVYNGVELPAGLASDNIEQRTEWAERPVLILSGTLHPAKGQDEAIRALAQLHRRGIDCQLRLLGADAVGFQATLMSLATQLGVRDSVCFIGHLTNPWHEIALATVVLVCSRCEGFGRATVEAMLLGKAVVAANRCGTVELIEDEHTGLLYDCGDEIRLANKIERLLTDTGLAVRLGNRARDVARSRFSVEQYVDSVFEVYDSVL